jgi:hypothetical protein
MAWMLRQAALFCGLYLFALTPLFGAGPVDDIKALVDKGDAAAAYRFGRSHQDQFGNPAFDFYFGIAAIDSGHAGEGVLALERYTINYPENLSARLELARGYYVLGDDVRAREEFNYVLESNPPAGVRANVDRFLAAMRARESEYRVKLGGFIEAAYGYDTNANGGVNNALINLPGFGDVMVNEDGLRAKSPYQWLAAGGRISRPLAPGFVVLADGRMDSKFHSLVKQFDQRNASGSAGLSYLKNKNLYRGVVSYSLMTVNDDRFRNMSDAAVELLHQLNELDSVRFVAQYGRLRYAGSNQARNVDFGVVGAGYRKAFISRWQPQVSANLHGGKERNIEGRPDLGRQIAGANAGLSLAPGAKWTLSTGVNYQASRYQSEDPLTLTRRKEHYYAIDTVANYAYTRQVNFGLELLLARNDSNLALYEYERGLVTFKIRYEFR